MCGSPKLHFSSVTGLPEPPSTDRSADFSQAINRDKWLNYGSSSCQTVTRTTCSPMAASRAPVAVQLTTPPPPGLQEAVRNSTIAWQEDLETLFKQAKDRFPDVVWEFVPEDDDEDPPLPIARVGSVARSIAPAVDQVWGHKGEC
mgnify:CR=1 FL=1